MKIPTWRSIEYSIHFYSLSPQKEVTSTYQHHVLSYIYIYKCSGGILSCKWKLILIFSHCSHRKNLNLTADSTFKLPSKSTINGMPEELYVILSAFRTDKAASVKLKSSPSNLFKELLEEPLDQLLHRQRSHTVVDHTSA